jgi:hypothetical protein
MRTSVETIPLLKSGPSDLNQNLLTKRQLGDEVGVKCEDLAIKGELLYAKYTALMQFLPIL